MRKEIADIWIKELRSGNWTQTTDALCSGGSHCCLGVLCEIALQGGIVSNVGVEQYGVVNPKIFKRFDEEIYTLPQSVKKWADMKSEVGKVDWNEDKLIPSFNLAEMNDSGSTFSEIADKIEERWQDL